MIIQTSRFGPLEVDGDRLITFERGILGFPEQNQYALIQTGENSAFYWMQSVDREDLAFVVCDPRLFVADYRVPIKMEELALIGVDDPDKAQVFVIVNKIEDVLTGNLQGPLAVNVQTRQGRQLVLSDRKFSTRHPLVRLPKTREMSRTG